MQGKYIDPLCRNGLTPFNTWGIACRLDLSNEGSQFSWSRPWVCFLMKAIENPSSRFGGRGPRRAFGSGTGEPGTVPCRVMLKKAAQEGPIAGLLGWIIVGPLDCFLVDINGCFPLNLRKVKSCRGVVTATKIKSHSPSFSPTPKSDQIGFDPRPFEW